MTRVLLTSFEPFGTHTLNSSLEVGRAVARRPPRGVELEWVVLPVVAGACVERAWACVEQAGPDLVLALGQAAGAAVLRLEGVAANVNDFSIPDNAGNLLVGQPVVAGGPAAYRATVPLRRLAGALAGRGVPAGLSASAGRYVCNHLLYGLLHRAARRGCGHRTGFAHLPLLPGQVSRRSPSPALGLDVLAEGVRTIIEACREARPAAPFRD